MFGKTGAAVRNGDDLARHRRLMTWVRIVVCAAAVAAACVLSPSVRAETPSADPNQKAAASGQGAAGVDAPAPAAEPEAPQPFDIDEFRIDGADKLAQIDVEEAIYPFLGPSRTPKDVEKARAALEKAYHDRGYQTVNVSVPPQNVSTRVVVLKVAEVKVGRLRVAKSRYYDVEKIKAKVPSLKEGAVPNFNDVTTDIVAINQWPDRRVTPALRAGVAPGTVDVDLNVEDRIPIHASVEYNNRQSPSTTQTLLNATVRYENLWQRGHSLTASYQVAPQRKEDAEAISANYLARVTDWTSVLFYGVKTKSDVSTIGGLNVIGPGQIFGTRAIFTLPTRENFFHSISFGIDYKHFGQTSRIGDSSFDTPITYYPLVVSYGATWQTEQSTTQFSAGVTTNLRGLGSGFDEFDAKRYFANANFAHFNAELSHTQQLWRGFQLYGRVKGQLADNPLISSEQFGLGGVDTVRGYFETEVVGDDGVAGTVELRTPDLGVLLQANMKDETASGPARFTIFNEWRIYAFADAGSGKIHNPLPEQTSRFDLWSYGVGTRFKLFNTVNGAVALALPQITQTSTPKGKQAVLFSFGAEF